MSHHKRVVAFGELLLRLEAPGHARIVQAESFVARYTGAEANVAVALAVLGFDAAVVSKVPDNEIGQACINYLRRFGVDTDGISRGGERLGLLYVETGASPRPTKVVYDRAGSAFAASTASDYDWPAILDGAAWLHFSGTAAAGGAAVALALAEALELAGELGVAVSCDLNFRSGLWSAARAGEVLAPLMPFVDVLTGAGEDAARVFGIDLHAGHLGEHGLSLGGFEHVALRLRERFGLGRVAGVVRLSRTGDPVAAPRLAGVIVDDRSTSCSGELDQPEVVDRIGAGDAFSAGVVCGSLSGWPAKRTAELAVALYCLAQTIEGDFALVEPSEAEALAGGSGPARVQR